MRSKLLWLVLFISIFENIYKHGYMLRLYIDITLKFTHDRHKPLLESFITFLQTLSVFTKQPDKI